MIPCERLGNNARYMDALADTTPPGLLGTPFGVVSDALRAVAASVWDVDPTVYRAGIAWSWYLGARPSALAVGGFRALLCAALVSECAPLVRESQTVTELLALLTLWMDYRPVFADMEALFATYGVRVDARAISDPEGQTLLPVDDTRLAFYIFVLSMDWARPMLLGEIAETARRASPLGARPFVVYLVEGLVSVPVAIAPTDGFLWVDVWESAVPVSPPAPTLPTVSYIGRFIYSGGGLSAGEIGTLRDSSNNTITYNTGVSYAVYWYASSNWSYGDVSYVSLVNESSLLKVKNISNTHIDIYFVSTYECSSNQATVVTVYDSSNNAYNAFKYTANNTDYYYVLDGTQTDWTDDLSNIGYSLGMQFYFNMSGDNPADVTFDYPSSNNYWGLRIRNQSEKDTLDSLGLFQATQYPASAPYGYLKASTAQASFSYELKAIFLPDGTQAPFSLSDFYCNPYNTIECVKCGSSYSTPVRSCLISIKPIS